jgi:hypothetical protein
MPVAGHRSLSFDRGTDASIAAAARFTSAFVIGRVRMKKVLLAASLVAFGLGGPMASAVYAANADNPYGNVDHSNDKGNDTGDSRVDGLNSNQLNGNYRGPLELRPPNGPVTMVPVQPGMTAPPPPPPPPAPIAR